MSDQMTHANEKRHNAACDKIPSYNADVCRMKALGYIREAMQYAASPATFDMCDDLIHYCTRAVRRINRHGVDGSDDEVAYLLRTADLILRLLDQTL
jgi:hypothetical protein